MSFTSICRNNDDEYSLVLPRVSWFFEEVPLVPRRPVQRACSLPFFWCVYKLVSLVNLNVTKTKILFLPHDIFLIVIKFRSVVLETLDLLDSFLVIKLLCLMNLSEAVTYHWSVFTSWSSETDWLDSGKLSQTYNIDSSRMWTRLSSSLLSK